MKILEVAGVKFDENPNDFLVGAESDIVIQENKNKTRHFYNQYTNPRTRYGCAIFAACGCISDFTGYKFSDQEILNILDIAERDYGWRDKKGMYMSRAIDCVRNYWNTTYPDKKLTSFNARIGTKDFYEALKKNHSLAVGYLTSKEYTIDSQTDGKIDKDDYPKKSGHLVRCNGDIMIDDNYYELKKFNTYENKRIEALRKNGVFFPSAYFFQYENYDQDNRIREEIVQEIQKIVRGYKDKGIKRIRIFDDLIARGYTKKNALLAIRREYNMHVTEEM